MRGRAAPRAGAEPLHGRALVGEGRGDEELVGDLAVIVDGVRDRRGEDLGDDRGGLARRGGQDLLGAHDVLAAHEVEHLAGPCDADMW